MSGRRLLILGLLIVAAILGGLFYTWKQTLATRELDRLIAAIPPKPDARATLSDLERYAGGPIPVARLIELLDEAGRYGIGASLGDRIYEMSRRVLVLARLEELLPLSEPDPATRELVMKGLQADLTRDPEFAATLQSLRDDWFRWLVMLRTGEAPDEDAVIGPPNGVEEFLGGRRIGDGSIFRGWRAIERFFARAEMIPLSRDDYPAAIEALVETPANAAKDPVTTYFAGFATRDLKFTWRKLKEIRETEERLLRLLE